MYRNGEYEIATIKVRPLFLKLSDADCDRILQLTAGYGLTVSELLENFVADLVGGTCTNGSDERSLSPRTGFRVAVSGGAKTARCCGTCLKKVKMLRILLSCMRKTKNTNFPLKNLKISAKFTVWNRTSFSILSTSLPACWMIGKQIVRQWIWQKR